MICTERITQDSVWVYTLPMPVPSAEPLVVWPRCDPVIIAHGFMLGMRSLWTPLAVSEELRCVFMLQGKLENARRLGRGWIIHGDRGRGAVKAFIFTFLPLAVLLPGALHNGVSWGKKVFDYPSGILTPEGFEEGRGVCSRPCRCPARL